MEERIVDEGWVGKPKGLLQVLWETGWINPDKPRSKYKKSAKKDRDYDEEGNIKSEVAEFTLTHLMANRHDFATETTDLQQLGMGLSTDDAKVQIMYTPKYHCEFAGEGIEYAWGFCKKVLRGLPLSDKRTLETFLDALTVCLKHTDVDRIR